MDNYLLNTRDQYYMEGGMRVYNLKEVLISRKTQLQQHLHRGGYQYIYS